MFGIIKNLFDDNRRRLSSFRPLIDQINSLEPQISHLSDKQLSKKTLDFKNQLHLGKSADDILPEVFAVVREAIRRTIGERAYDAQLLAAIALHRGAIAEQKTGEGKTHSVVFPAYLNSLSGKGVHIITPNDYLSRLGAGWYPQALTLLGISTSCIVHEASFVLDPNFNNPAETIDDRLAHLKPISRKEAYLADVTYGTNNEFGFDYLRDHLVNSSDDMVQRGHYYAVVDEVDFVLIDEARTPLIISSPNNQPTDKYYQFAQIASGLQPADYVIDEKARSATLSEFGIRKVEKILQVANLYEESFETIHYIENAIKAIALFHKDKDYVIKDNEIIIVDEFTGRLMYGRRWSDCLHQAIEAKESVTVQRESQTWATITFQNYFRLYQKLAGMTGTAATEAEEFKKIYNLDVVVVPTHRPLIRTDRQDLIFKTQRAKYAAVAGKIEELYRLGQPVLIGTTSIEKNDVVSSLLKKKGIPHQVLNAKNHQTEAEIIAKAGVKGSITVATNMDGRGVDIILGGPKDKTPNWQQRHDDIVKLGGLYIIGTERHESRRIDNQLRGRSGRQGDPGVSEFYIALDDDLMRIFGGDKISTLMTRFNMPEEVPLTHSLVTKVVEQIQVKVEGYNFDLRKNLVEYDDVINKQRQIIYGLRDKTLSQAKNKPDLNRQEIFSRLTKEVNFLLAINIDSQTSQPDFAKIILEFSEILPLNETNRQKLLDQIKSSSSPASLLLKELGKQWQQRVDFFGADITNSILTYALISTLDPLWVEHLTHLDDLRDGVRLRGYAQKDPLIEFRKEGYDMFQKLINQFESNLNRKIFRLEPVPLNLASSSPNVNEGRGGLLDFNQPPDSALAPSGQLSPMPLKPVTPRSTLGRNDPDRKSVV